MSFSAGSFKSRVAILIEKGLQLRLRKEIKDEEGRIIIIPAAKQGQTDFFFVDLESKCMILEYQYPIILAGESNIVFNQILDRSTSTLSRNIYTDVWRLNHPMDRDYTFYSGAQKVYSRIDFLLLAACHTVLFNC